MDTFPKDPLAEFKRKHAPQTRRFLSKASIEPHSLKELLALANQQELELWQEFSLGYCGSQGDEQLRTQIASQYPGLEAENILIFSGAQEAVFTVYQALLNPHSKSLIITPTYGPLLLSAQGTGADTQLFPMNYSEQAGWQLDIDQWKNCLSNQVNLATINFPHNPTGYLPSTDELKTMVTAAQAADLWLFSDEVFRGLEYDINDRLPPVASLYSKGISLGVMGKAYALGGVRLGWIACQDKALIKRLLEIKSYLSICTGRADEILALIAARNAEVIFNRNIQIAKANLKLIEEHQAQLDIIWHSPHAGCLAFPRLRKQSNAQKYAESLLESTQSMIIPGNCFMQGANHVRLGYGFKDFNWQTLKT